jgi:flagellar basal-body rod modification protein FlgD
MQVNSPTSLLPADQRYEGSKTPTSGNAEINKDSFMLLLVEQLKNQDPMSPLDNNAFLAQLAQFNSMESMQNMSTNIDSLVKGNTVSRAGAMVGRIVKGLDSTTGDLVQGFVQKVSLYGDQVDLTLQEQAEDGTVITHTVPMDSITEIQF